MTQHYTTLTQTMAGRDTAKMNDLLHRIRMLSALYAAETDPATKKAIKALGAKLIRERDEFRGGR